MISLLFLLSPALADWDMLLEEQAGRTTGPRVVLPRRLAPPPASAPPDKQEAPPAPPIAPTDLPGETEGALSGKAVYLSQCHGWLWYDSLGAFSTQRGNLFDTVEDFHNPEGADQYLARYLENAGARVYTVRERDLYPRMSIADNDGTGYAETGSGFVDGGPGFAEGGPWAYGENPFESGSTRRFPADGGARATWTPEVPADGVYAIYLSWETAPDNARAGHYRITHPGGVIDRYFDQSVHGSTWQYAERLWLPAGFGGLVVELIADGGETGRYLSADAVRIGGGIGDVERHGEVTARPRWEDGGILSTQWNGAPVEVYDPWLDGNGSDPSSRSRWAAWEHPAGEPAVYLSWHSNAGGGTGTSTYIYDSGPTEGSEELGSLLQEELVDSIRALWDSGWTDRGLRSADFSEVNPSHNDEMPAALVELAFHDHPDDTALLKEPLFRQDASRAMMRAIVRYFAAEDGTTPVFLPEPPEGLALLHDVGGELVLSWEPGPVGEPFGDVPTSYLVYRSRDGRAWDNGTEVGNVSETRLEAEPGETVFARVVARNTGGLSFPSEVMGARRSPAGQAEVLVVAGYDRLRASNLPWESIGGAVGDVVRMDLPRVNGFDGVAAHGRAVAGAGWYFESIADERLGEIDLSEHSRVVFWNAGEEGSQDTTFTPDQQVQLRAFQAAGGALWVTGAEVLWDLDDRGDETDRLFAGEVLGALMESDDSGTEQASGEEILDGLLLDFGEADGSPYPVEYPDVLASAETVIGRYTTGGAAAILGEGRALFGFPFECIGEEATRIEVAARLLPALVPGYTPPEVEDPGDTADPGDSGITTDDTGPDDEQPEGPEPDRHGAPPGNLVPLDQGCGCGAAPVAPGLLSLAAMLLAWARRRRPPL